jgi:predicted transcriptional regulator
MDRTDMIEKILEEAQVEAGLTERKIMYLFALPSVDVDLYVSSMMRNGLLHYDIKTNTYRTTDKGFKFLETIRSIYELDEITE